MYADRQILGSNSHKCIPLPHICIKYKHSHADRSIKMYQGCGQTIKVYKIGICCKGVRAKTG